MSRQAFEALITAPPIDLGIGRFDDRGAWPGSYRSYDVDLAWQAYKAATNAALELAAEVCDNLSANGMIVQEWQTAADYCADAIRQLKDKTE